MNIAVLAGGYSPERDVSLVSAILIARALCRNGHRVALIDAYLGTDLPEEGAEALFSGEITREYSITESVPDLEKLRNESGNGDALVGKNVIEVCRAADIVYIGLHGASGENGEIQALLDCHGIKYTGTGYLGCALAMDKEISKVLFRGAGIDTPDGITATRESDAGRILREVGLPCVIKPCSCGSSVGVSIVRDRDSLGDALSCAFAYEDRVLAEKLVTGREMTVGILCGEALPPIEIIPKSGFYDYKNKYQGGMTEEICPPDITGEEDALLRKTALRAMRALRIDEHAYCRVDVILSGDGTPVVLEVNTLPGMTPTSLLPQAAAAAGIGYDALCEKIAVSAYESRKNGL
ncbi:MAG: D-alanine--D-alanine ligase [Clostridia bacterium]|nr:D-alanine--D-alanine ligase [Clostridia bacterium]